MTNVVDRYDYLEFKDSHGKTVKCDEKVGSSSWLKVLKFPNCSRLQFSFRSDSSGVDWGYKFKVYIVFSAFVQFGLLVNFVSAYLSGTVVLMVRALDP